MTGQPMAEQTPPASARFTTTHQPSPERRFRGPREPAPSRIQVNCPHCRDLALLRTSRQTTPLFKELRFQCVNIECGHTFVGSLTIDRTIVPSARPNPAIKLRMAPRPGDHANDDAPAEAD